MVALSQATLGDLPAGIAVPAYDRRALRAGIVHFGVGNFHRTHQAIYTDACLHRAGQEAWGIVGVGLTDGGGGPHQGHRTIARRTASIPSPSSRRTGQGTTRVIGAMIDYLHAPADPEAVLARLCHPDTKIVTLTITEGGYNIDEATGTFMLDTPDVAHDLEGGPPRSAFGFVVEALARRRASGRPAFTVASCDNLRGNGDTARKAFVSFARARDAALADWIDAEADFPNSMVDRIAPQIPDEVKAALNARSGIEDRVPAMAESFNQWVVEDRFRQGRPDFGAVGVQFRDDVAAVVAVKGRMLNAAHMMMCWPSLLMGHRIVHEAMRDERLARLIVTFVERDVVPYVRGSARHRPRQVQGHDRGALRQSRRWRPNLCGSRGDGASKLPIFHAKTLSTLMGRPVPTCGGKPSCWRATRAACSASDDEGARFSFIEPVLTPADWDLIRSAPAGVLRASPFAAIGLDTYAPFRTAFDAMADALARQGASRTLDDVLAA